MKEIGMNLNMLEVSFGVTAGLILIAIIFALIGSAVFSDDQKSSHEEFVEKLKKKEDQLKEKEEKLKQIEEQLRGLR